VNQHGCLPNLLGDRDKGMEIVYGEEKLFCTVPTRAAKAEQKTLVPARQAQHKLSVNGSVFQLKEAGGG
jgi:hypothetical protein